MRSRSLDCLRRLLPVLTLLPALVGRTPVSAQVLTQHNDNFRTGANITESQLNTSNVNVNQFGRLFKRQVDGQIYAQPLVARINMPNIGNRYIVFVATEHDSVYAFEAGNPNQAQPYWHTSFINPAAGVTSVNPHDVNAIEINQEIGITGTPVIDLSSGTLYVVASTTEVSNGNVSHVQRLHALDVATGAEKFGGPVVIQATVPGTGEGSDGNGHLTFDPLKHLQRPGLLLLNGVVYIAFGSHSDQEPYHGWIFGYNAKTLAQTTVFCTTPNGITGAIWQSGAGLSADAAGNIYALIANGDFNADTGGQDYGDSFLKLSQGSLQVLDYFTPYNQQNLNDFDADLGSVGALLLPDANLAVGGGKEGKLYLVDRANMGHYNAAGDTQVADWIWGDSAGLWSPLIYWNGPNGPTVYVWGEYDFLKAYQIDTVNKKFNRTPLAQSAIPANFPGGILALSSNGKQAGTGIVWAATADGDADEGNTSHGTLRAFDAVTLQELWNSGMNPARDDLGNFAKFCPPTVLLGKVFMATFSNELVVYGLGPWADAPVITPNGGSAADGFTITMTDSTPGAVIRYTIDGTEPTVSSRVYTGPIHLTLSAQVQAKAYALNLYESAVTSALFAVGDAGVGTGDGAWANYFDTVDLSGPSLDRIDPSIDFTWADSNENPLSPLAGLGLYNWSTRWLAYLEPRYTAYYTFAADTDDGVRLFVNGQKVIDNWQDQALKEAISAPILLRGGYLVKLEMDYYQRWGIAAAHLYYSNPVETKRIIPQSQLYSNHVATPVITPIGSFATPITVTITESTPGAGVYYTLDGSVPTGHSAFYTGPFTLSKSATINAKAAKAGLASSAVGSANITIDPNTPTGLSATYFSNIDLTGNTVMRIDPTLDFTLSDGGTGAVSPVAGIGPYNWSARWTGFLVPRYSETYTFTTGSDDGVRVWVNGQEIINDWTNHALTNDSGTITLTAGQPVSIKVEYYQWWGLAALHLYWQSNNQAVQIVPQSQLYPAAAP